MSSTGTRGLPSTIWVFMLRHNLQFTDADNPEERELFPQLYAKLGEQRDRFSQGLAVQDDAPKN